MGEREREKGTQWKGGREGDKEGGWGVRKGGKRGIKGKCQGGRERWTR